MFQGQDILNSFNLEVSISPFSKMLLFCYYTKNMIIDEVYISQAKCFDLKYHLETNFPFQISGKIEVFVLLIHEHEYIDRKYSTQR